MLPARPRGLGIAVLDGVVCPPTVGMRTQQGGVTVSGDPACEEDRGTLCPTAGWDLGRNDHTDDVGEKRPAETIEFTRTLAELPAER
ncbi:hypothetical protein CS0771_13380 [Catellatospora sp. IY07-71]|nr:hypothetical protein CS0771_13380 [Catellatospora sp. IY07-71]